MKKIYVTFEDSIKVEDNNDMVGFMTKKHSIPPYLARKAIRETTEGIHTVTKDYTIYEDLMGFSFGLFIELERLVTAPNISHENKLMGIALMLIRKPDEVIYDNSDQTTEPEHIKSVINEPLNVVMDIINKYLKARQHFLHVKFEGAFYKSEKDEDDKDLDADVKKDDSNVNNSGGEWYWHSLVKTLANDDITKFETVREMPLSIVAVDVAHRRWTQVQEAHERELEEFKRKAKSGS